MKGLLKPTGSDASREAQIQALRLRFKPVGLDSSLEAQIQAGRLKHINGVSSSQDPFPRLSKYRFYLFYWFYWFFEGFIGFSSKIHCFIAGPLPKTLRILFSNTERMNVSLGKGYTF